MANTPKGSDIIIKSKPFHLKYGKIYTNLFPKQKIKKKNKKSFDVCVHVNDGKKAIIVIIYKHQLHQYVNVRQRCQFCKMNNIHMGIP